MRATIRLAHTKYFNTAWKIFANLHMNDCIIILRSILLSSQEAAGYAISLNGTNIRLSTRGNIRMF